MGDSNRQNHHNDRYSSRQYQPYVFRPNFMKNTDGQTKQYGRKVIDWTGSCAQTIISRRFKAAEILIWNVVLKVDKIKIDKKSEI